MAGEFFKLNFFAALTRRRNVYTIVNSRGNGGYRAGYLFPLVSVFQPVKYENAFRTLAKQRPRKRTDVVKGFSSAVRSNSFLNSDRDQANYPANFTTVIWSRCVSLSLSLVMKKFWQNFDIGRTWWRSFSKKRRWIRRTKEAEDDLSKDRITPGGRVTRATKCSTFVVERFRTVINDGTPAIAKEKEGHELCRDCRDPLEIVTQNQWSFVWSASVGIFVVPRIKLDRPASYNSENPRNGSRKGDRKCSSW